MNALPSEEAWKPRFNPWLIALAVMLSTFMEVLDTTIVSVAQPNMAGSLAATNDEASWVLTSYLVANAIVLPASGWLALKFGRKRFLLACTVLFTIMSVACGFAPSMRFLVVSRVLQGAAGGALQPLSQAILMESFPIAKRAIAMAVYALGIVIAPVLGPLAGGWLTDHYSWRWVFYINVPFGLVSVLMMLRYVEDPPYIRNANAGKIDGIGFGFLALWLGALQLVLDRGQNADWFDSSFICWLAAISGVALVMFLRRELTTRNPIVDLSVLKSRNFAAGCALVLLISAGMYGGLTIMPLFLQTLLGYTAELAGLATAPRGIGSLLGAIAVGILASRIDGRKICLAGLVCFVGSSFMLARLNTEVAMSNIVLPNLIMGVGLSLIMVTLMTMAMGLTSNEQVGNATSVYNLARNLGGSIGISISSAWVIRFAQMHQTDLGAHMTPYDPVFQQRVGELTQHLSTVSGGAQAQQQAFAFMQNTLLQQANLKAYMTVFMITGLVLVLCMPALLLFRKVQSKGQVMLH